MSISKGYRTSGSTYIVPIPKDFWICEAAANFEAAAKIPDIQSKLRKCPWCESDAEYTDTKFVQCKKACIGLALHESVAKSMDDVNQKFCLCYVWNDFCVKTLNCRNFEKQLSKCCECGGDAWLRSNLWHDGVCVKCLYCGNETGEVFGEDKKKYEDAVLRWNKWNAKKERVLEGKRILRLHQSRERNRSIVAAKKAHSESLKCECCGFCFESFYGQIGAGYCEAHHISPLSESEDECTTSIDDLAIVCANCHRMLHRKGLISIDELKNRINAEASRNFRTAICH